MTSHGACPCEFPPAPPPIFDVRADLMIAKTQQIISNARSSRGKVLAYETTGTASFETWSLPLAQEENDRLFERQLIEFNAYVSTKDEIRHAAQESARLFSEFDTETSQDKMLYEMQRAVAERTDCSDLDPESHQLLRKTLLSFERNGLALAAKDKDILRKIKQSLTEVEHRYINDCDRNRTDLWLTRSELAGLDNKFLDTLEAGSGVNVGRIRLQVDGSCYHDLLSNASRSATRRLIYLAYAQGGNTNESLLRETLALRDQKAQLLGYANHAEYRMAGMMEKSPQKIQVFLDELLLRISSAGENFIARMRQLKGEEKFYAWDRFYYSKQLLQEEYAFDASTISEYFELNETIARMLEIFAEVFGMIFVEVRNADRGAFATQFKVASNALTWHPEVRMFAVWDDSHDQRKEAKEFLGYLYMDMHPRPGKRSGFADLPVQPAYNTLGGSRKYTSTALVCNFNRPSATKPCLLEHHLVVLLFHELGHAIHDLVAKTRYARFHGASTAGDFNEAPSQMLEQWCWHPGTLRRLSKHYSQLSLQNMEAWRKQNADVDELDILPEDLIEKLVRSRSAKNLSSCLGILSASLFDMAINSAEDPGNLDATKLFHTISTKVFNLDPPDVDELPPFHAAQDTHFTVDAMYIYLVSQIYALDMFDSAFKRDPLNRAEGLRYRRTVLEKGSSMDEMQFLTEFLGRPPTADAFYGNIGLAM